MEKVLFVSITVFGILLRLLYSLSSASDENVTFWLIKRQEKSRWVNYDVPDSIIEGFYGYPVLIQFLVGKLPSGVQVILGRIFNSKTGVNSDFFLSIESRPFAIYIQNENN